jgi:oxygen-independent coproporphyrinogen-3 oxidase
MREIDFYSDIIGNRPVTSFYIGGGTPTTMLHSGLQPILEHVFKSFNMQCTVHMESHPNDLSPANLGLIRRLGVRHLSVGVEALQDQHLRSLRRPYTVAAAAQAVQRAVNTGFDCVNVDMMFALPKQTYAEVEEAGRTVVDWGVDQVAAYPLFTFAYTPWARLQRGDRFNIYQKRRMLSILEHVFYGAGFERTSVWAFTRRGAPKYCSVTVPLYFGLGASGASYLKDVFYLNTFNVDEYIVALERAQSPIALSLDLSETMQMAGWLYWRIYETRFAKADFRQRFGKEIPPVLGHVFRLLSHLGLLQDTGSHVILSDRGAFWLHAIQDLFSIEYVSRLWGTSKQYPWPQSITL